MRKSMTTFALGFIIGAATMASPAIGIVLAMACTLTIIYAR